MAFTPASSWSLWLAGRVGFAHAAAFPFAFAIVVLGVLAAIVLWRLFATVHRRKREGRKSKALFSRSTTICLAIWAIPSVVLAVDPNFGLQVDASHDETSAKNPAKTSANQADVRSDASKKALRKSTRRRMTAARRATSPRRKTARNLGRQFRSSRRMPKTAAMQGTSEPCRDAATRPSSHFPSTETTGRARERGSRKGIDLGKSLEFQPYRGVFEAPESVKLKPCV